MAQKTVSTKKLEKTLVPAVRPGDKVPMAKEEKDREIVEVLTGYKQEADQNRKGGPNPRDDKWQENLDLYWNRHDFSNKASWQARQTMPEVPGYVDRLAAALKEALIATPDGFYTVKDPADVENDMAGAIKRMTNVWLSTCGRNQVGQLLSFPSVFEEQMKLGAIMSCASVVTWKNDVKDGRVAVETVDPRFVWLDTTYRNLYRIRRTELDRHDLFGMVKMKDGKGKPIFDVGQIDALVTAVADDDRAKKEELAGSGQTITSNRKPIVLDEYIATVIGRDGEVLSEDALHVVANDRFLIRGPEKNPFWHGKDWMVYCPLVTAPLSVYGRSYMEDFGSLSRTFTELTNMILDAVHASTLHAYAVVPGMLVNPQQLASGISPHKLFLLEDGFKAEDFAKKLELGGVNADAVKVWETLKSELGEAARTNEIGLGQFAPNSRTSATEIEQTTQSSSALIRSLAQTVEVRYLDPMLDLIWKTGLQHVKPDNAIIEAAVGKEMFAAMIQRRKEFIKRPITFQSRGISALIQRSQELKVLMTLMQVVASNDVLLKEFLGKVDMGKLVQKLFELSNIDITSLQTSQRDQMIRSVTEPMGMAAERVEGAASPSITGGETVNSLINTLKIGQG